MRRIREIVDPSYWRLRRIFVGRWTAEEVAAIRRRARQRHQELLRYTD